MILANAPPISEAELQLAKYSKTKLQDGVQLYDPKIDKESTNLIDANGVLQQ